MALSNCNLSNPKYGYDVVVATTQESINAGLTTYLLNTNGKQPISYRIFIADIHGAPVIEHTLDEFLKLYPAVSNPFDIPNGTDYSDPRITALTQVRFVSAIKIEVGIPPGCVQGGKIVLPEPIISLNDGATNVLFNLYCKEVAVVQNTPPSGFGDGGAWTWYSQQQKPWYITTRTDLTVKDLNKDLDTDYFNSHPAIKAALLTELENVSGSAFSLQQLLLNLDSAIAQTVPDFNGEIDSTPLYLLRRSFIYVWSVAAKTNGEPLLSVAAVAQTPDPSSVHLTQIERWVSPVVDPNGQQILNPTGNNLNAATLNYLCTTKSTLPVANSFNWNWVDPQAIDQSSGVVAVRREIIGEYLAREMIPQAQKSCFVPAASVDAYDIVGGVNYKCSFTNMQMPQVVVHDTTSPVVASLTWTSAESRSHDSDDLTYGEFNVQCFYTCDIVLGKSVNVFGAWVYLGGSTFTVVQNLKIHAYVQWSSTSCSPNIIDITQSDEYVVSVDGNGALTSAPDKANSNRTDASQSGDLSAIANAFTNINDLISSMQSQLDSLKQSAIQPIPFDNIRGFVFPGGQTFTFKDAEFSKGQDLYASITYTNPTLPSGTALSKTIQSAPNIVTETSELSPIAAMVKSWRDGNARSSGSAIPATTTPTEQDAYIKGKDISDSTSIELSISSELMLNYVQGEVVQPDGKFRALQMSDGHGLVFAATSNGVLNAFQESTGQQKTGWTTSDLSTQFIDQHLVNGKVRTWDVAQSVMDNGSIAMGMAVTTPDVSDTLCLSLFNSSTSTAWTASPSWQTVPFDAVGPKLIQITNIWFSETDSGQQYILVDILRDPSSTLKATSRYIVDPTAKPCWQLHTLPFDIEEGTYQSCIGRVADAIVDGVYTTGTVQGVGQLEYVPLFNVVNNAPPMPSRLVLPGVASAIASSRNTDGYSHFFAVSGTTLYYWPPDGQDDRAQGLAVINNTVLQNTDTLIALTQGGITTLFGKDSSDVVYYTSCPENSLSDGKSWTSPIPVLSGIERISSYINRADGGNTVYAAGGDALQQITRAVDGSGLWQSHTIMLAAPPQTKATSFMSYTTHLQTVKDRIATSDIDVVLTTPNRMPVYINGLYYVLSKDPITVKSGTAGVINIIQATKSVVGAVISATVGGITSTINPMETAVAKLKTLSDDSSLKNAQVVTNTVAGGILDAPTTKYLVASTASSDDLKLGAQGIKGLSTAYDKCGKSVAATIKVKGFMDGIAVAAGDLYNWLKTGIDKAIQIVEDTASGVWHFVVNIAGKIYTAVLDSYNAIVGAFEWVFDKLKTAIEDLIAFLEFLFAWKDIKRTKMIMHNMCNYFLQDISTGIKMIQDNVDKSIAGAQKAVAQLTGVDWTSLGESASKVPGGDATDTDKGQTASSQMLSNHFQNQAQNMSLSGDIPGGDGMQELIDALISAMDSEGDVLSQTIDQLTALASDVVKLPLSQILIRLVGIITETVLGSAQVVMDAIFNLLETIAESVVGVLNYKIHVPILSDILNALGIDDLSFLDIITWVAATAFTLVYKVIEGEAPFPDNDSCEAMASAQDWNSLQAAVNGAKSTSKTRSKVKLGASATSNALYKAGHAISGALLWAGGNYICLEAMDPASDNPFGMGTALLGIGCAAAAGAADFLAPQSPIQDAGVAWTNRGTMIATIIFKGWFSGIGQKMLAKTRLKKFKSDDGRAVGAAFNCVLIIPAFFCTCWHFCELSELSVSRERSCAIMNETASLMQYFGRLSYLLAVNDSDELTRVVPVFVLKATNEVVSDLQIAMSIAS